MSARLFNPFDFTGWLNEASRYGELRYLSRSAPYSYSRIDWANMPTPTDFSSRLQQGNLRFHSNEYSDSVRLYELIVRDNRSSRGQIARAYYNIGVVRMHQNQPNEAIEAFQNAYEHDESLIAPIFARGCILYVLNRYREAFDTFSAAGRLFHIKGTDFTRSSTDPIVDPGLATVFQYTKVNFNTSLAYGKISGEPQVGENSGLLHTMDRSKVFESEFELESMKGIGRRRRIEKIREEARKYGRKFKGYLNAGIVELTRSSSPDVH